MALDLLHTKLLIYMCITSSNGYNVALHVHVDFGAYIILHCAVVSDEYGEVEE